MLFYGPWSKLYGQGMPNPHCSTAVWGFTGDAQYNFDYSTAPQDNFSYATEKIVWNGCIPRSHLFERNAMPVWLSFPMASKVGGKMQRVNLKSTAIKQNWNAIFWETSIACPSLQTISPPKSGISSAEWSTRGCSLMLSKLAKAFVTAGVQLDDLGRHWSFRSCCWWSKRQASCLSEKTTTGCWIWYSNRWRHRSQLCLFQSLYCSRQWLIENSSRACYGPLEILFSKCYHLGDQTMKEAEIDSRWHAFPHAFLFQIPQVDIWQECLARESSYVMHPEAKNCWQDIGVGAHGAEGGAEGLTSRSDGSSVASSSFASPSERLT